MNRHDIISGYNQELYSVYKEFGLICLSDDNYTIYGVNVLAVNNPAVFCAAKAGVITRLNEVCDELGIVRQVKNPNIMQHELIVASGDIKHRTGTLFLNHSYIVNLSSSWNSFQRKKHHYYRQTMEDGRFNRELPIAFESVCKYWQRIADYLYAFFPELLFKQKRQIYFPIPFAHVASRYPQLAVSDNFKWLNDFLQQNIPLSISTENSLFIILVMIQTISLSSLRQRALTRLPSPHWIRSVTIGCRT